MTVMVPGGGTVAPGRAAPPQVRRSVPGRIRVISGITVASLALLFAALAVGSATARDGLQVIGHDAGPQVVATAGLYLALSDMDAQVANILVMGNGWANLRQKAMGQYEQRRSEANQALLKAFELSGDNLAERRTVQSVLDGLGRYERLAGQALILDKRANHPPGPPPEEVVAIYRQATDLMRMVLLPQAYNLTLETGTIVRRTYDEKAVMVPLLRVAVVLSGLLAVCCLIWLQAFLAKRFRRVFGPALMVATVTTAVALIAGAGALARDQEALRHAKAAGFDPVLALTRARAIGDSMQGDQSRYLLDKERADTYEHTYLDKAQTILYTPAGNLTSYQGIVARDSSASFLGLLGPELVGKQGEEVLGAYRGFQAADRTYRDLVAKGRIAEAVPARLGPVTEAFAAYDRSLEALIDQHHDEFERAITMGESTLDNLWRLEEVAMGTIALLVIAGVWPRLKEYR
ncbi:hypothetical protein ACQEVF_04670 [Nonomuraea polychroma]|uniref:hypothetical protein n=1 Tax=Nonomuraea polychroma TaxID=46176 RepID=UPI003D8DDA24